MSFINPNLKAKLAEYFQEEVNIQNAPEGFGIDFVVRSRTGLPLGGFLFSETPQVDENSGFKIAQSHYLMLPIYTINEPIWDFSEELEIIEANKQEAFTKAVQIKKPVINTFIPKPLPPLPPALKPVNKDLSNFESKVTFNVYIKPWKAPDGSVRHYINGSGYTPQERLKNLLELFGYSITSNSKGNIEKVEYKGNLLAISAIEGLEPKVWFENGEVKVKHTGANKPEILPEAISYIKGKI